MFRSRFYFLSWSIVWIWTSFHTYWQQSIHFCYCTESEITDSNLEILVQPKSLQKWYYSHCIWNNNQWRVFHLVTMAIYVNHDNICWQYSWRLTKYHLYKLSKTGMFFFSFLGWYRRSECEQNWCSALIVLRWPLVQCSLTSNYMMTNETFASWQRRQRI